MNILAYVLYMYTHIHTHIPRSRVSVSLNLSMFNFTGSFPKRLHKFSFLPAELEFQLFHIPVNTLLSFLILAILLSR